jgi:hypothetical protein
MAQDDNMPAKPPPLGGKELPPPLPEPEGEAKEGGDGRRGGRLPEDKGKKASLKAALITLFFHDDTESEEENTGNPPAAKPSEDLTKGKKSAKEVPPPPPPPRVPAQFVDKASKPEEWCAPEFVEALRDICGIDVSEIDKTDYPMGREGEAIPGWKILAGTRRGRAHAHKGEHREDAFQFVSDKKSYAIAVVSDGAGSADLSRIGSEVLARVVCRKLAMEVEQIARERGTNTAAASKHAMVRAVKEAVFHARNCILDLAGRTQRQPQDFRCTLLLGLLFRVGEQDSFLAVRVGDGAIVAVNRNDVEKRIMLLTEAKTNDYGGLVDCFVPDEKMVRHIDRVLEMDANTLRGVFLCSDGIEDPYYPLTKYGELVFSQLCHGVGELHPDFKPYSVEGPILGSDKATERIADWLKFEKRGESDDRTILVFYRTPVLDFRLTHSRADAVKGEGNTAKAAAPEAAPESSAQSGPPIVSGKD